MIGAEKPPSRRAIRESLRAAAPDRRKIIQRLQTRAEKIVSFRRELPSQESAQPGTIFRAFPSPPLVLRGRVRVGVFIGPSAFRPHPSPPPEYQGRGKHFAERVTRPIFRHIPHG